jgi:hypothetical protein
MDQQDENVARHLDITAVEFFGACMMEVFDGVGG